MKLDEAWPIIRETCERCGHPEVSERIRLQWSNRMTSSIGHAIRKSGDDYYHIKLSTPLFKRADHAEQCNTVAHETCHIIDGFVNNCRMSHSAEWKRFMRLAGYSSERCHTVSVAGLVKRFIYECPNGCTEFRLSTRMHNSINRGKPRHCVKCEGRINYTERIK